MSEFKHMTQKLLSSDIAFNAIEEVQCISDSIEEPMKMDCSGCTTSLDESNNQATKKSAQVPMGSRTSSRKSSKSPAATTDWRLNLQGVVSKWEYLLENQLFTDITFLVGPSKEVVKCHSLVLKMQSRHFETTLTSDKQELEVPLSTAPVFRKMLKYLYTDKVEFTADDAMDALLLARQFHLTTLQAKCGRIVLEGINVENAAVLLKKAEDMGDKQLSLKVREYILQHATQVVITPGFKEIGLASLLKLLQANRALWKMNEVKILEAVKTWASAECARQDLEITGPNQYNVAKDAFDLIHYNQFTPMQFTSLVVKPKLLPSDKMLEIQSELIVKEESTKSEYSGSISHEHNDDRSENDTELSTAANPAGTSFSQEAVLLTEDIDQVKYDTIYTLNRYTTVSSKDWTSDNEDGTYKITFNVSKPINLLSLGLYGHANGDTSLVDIDIHILSYDEEKTYMEFKTKSELPEDGGEFEVKLPRPLSINKVDWYTVVIRVAGRVYPSGIGGKRTYTVETDNNDSVNFTFKNSKGVTGAAHVRGQLPKMYFSVPLFPTHHE